MLLGKPLSERRELRGAPGLELGALVGRDDAAGDPTGRRELDGVDGPGAAAGLFRASVLREELVGGVRGMRDAPAREGHREDLLLVEVQIGTRGRDERDSREFPVILIKVAVAHLERPVDGRLMDASGRVAQLQLQVLLDFRVPHLAHGGHLVRVTHGGHRLRVCPSISIGVDRVCAGAWGGGFPARVWPFFAEYGKGHGVRRVLERDGHSAAIVCGSWPGPRHLYAASAVVNEKNGNKKKIVVFLKTSKDDEYGGIQVHAEQHARCEKRNNV